MIRVTLLFIMLFPPALYAQNTYFFGIDLGPKFDYYQLATGGGRPYDPSMKIKNDIGAIFGVNGGVLVEEKLLLELGIYRSNFKAVFDIVNADGQTYFKNTPVNTFTSYMMPINIYGRKPIARKEGAFIYLGGGISTLLSTKTGINEVRFSHSEQVDPEDISKGTIQYTIMSDGFDAKIITLNLNTMLQLPINEELSATITLSTRFGVAGNNYIDIEHSTPQYPKVTNSFYTTGTGAQLQIGFKYFIIQP